MLRRETKTKITCPTTSDERRKERNVRIWSGYMSDNNATRPESTANRILNVMWRKRERRERERVIIIRRLADVAHPQSNTVKHNHQIEDSLQSDPNKTKKWPKWVRNRSTLNKLPCLFFWQMGFVIGASLLSLASISQRIVKESNSPIVK